MPSIIIPTLKAGKINLRSIKACISGSAPLLRETKEKFEAVKRRKGLRRATACRKRQPPRTAIRLLGVNKTGSIGMPLPDVECKIISLDDGETEMPLGEIGELVIHGPQVMKGYHNDPTGTRKCPAHTGGWQDLALYR